MQPSTPPKATKVQVVAARPTDADSAAIAHLSARDRKSLPQVTYLVQIRLESRPKATSQGWALYVNDFRIPKYWEYKDGIYFKVFDPQFFQDHQGESLRFSQNWTDMIDTGLNLPAVDSGAQRSAKTKLPLQDDLLRLRERRAPRARRTRRS
jgi:hypothetical protein